ncbi:MAG TPA: hypothetical protein VNW29_04355 [Candidatus Sulfotelmatobacter sp.]|jgi:hypothetical protein|nr:hypothetical protein [Candidatus Sulfotelmatobacter sp.]
MRIKHFCKKIRQMIRWIPILWDDEDWDSSYLFEIMRFKLKCIAKETERCDRHTTSERDVKQMRIAAELLHRFGFYEKTDSPECKCDHSKPIFEDVPDSKYSRFVWSSCAYCKAQYKIDAKQDEENWKLLWKFMEKYSQRWWN